MIPLPARDQRPKILRRDATIWLLRFRRLFQRVTRRELGLAHITRGLARVLPAWQRLPLEGPGGNPIYIDLRAKEGFFNHGYGQTIGHMRPLLDRIQDGSVVIDIGANIGLWSREVLAHKQLGRLVAFEPMRSNFDLLAMNLAAYPCASCECVALGDRDGTAMLSADRDNGQNHIVTASRDARRSQVVPLVTLDRWLRERNWDRLDVVKIDVEGFEFQVLSGSAETLRRCAPLVYFEFMPRPSALNDSSRRAFRLLQDHGYRMLAIQTDGGTVSVSTAESCDAVVAFSHDVLAIPPSGQH